MIHSLHWKPEKGAGRGEDRSGYILYTFQKYLPLINYTSITKCIQWNAVFRFVFSQSLITITNLRYNSVQFNPTPFKCKQVRN